MENFLTGQLSLRWRVPDLTFIVLSILVVALTWTMLLIAYPDLPSTIPSHFGFSGRPDATAVKSWWLVFFPGMMQIFLVGLTWWLSRHPQYINLPSTLTIKLLPEPTRSQVKSLLAHLLVMTGLITSLIMAYISLGTIQVSLQMAEGLNTWAMFSLVSLLILMIVIYTVRLNRLVRSIPPPSPAIQS